ncbi:hypothetical protein [Ekhidna sp.]
MIDMLPSLREDEIFDMIISQASFSKTWEDINETQIGENYVLPSTSPELDIIGTDNNLDFSKADDPTVTLPASTNESFEGTNYYSRTITINSQIISAIANSYFNVFVDFELFKIASVSNPTNEPIGFFVEILIEFDGKTESIVPKSNRLYGPFAVNQTEDQSVFDFFPDVLLNQFQNDSERSVSFRKQVSSSNPELEIKMKIYAYNAGVPTLPASEDLTIEYEIDTVVQVKELTSAQLEFEMEFENILPEIDQADFIKDALSKYGCSIKKDRISNHVTIRRLENILNDTTNIEDWSSKIIESVETEFQPNGYAKSSDFEYSDDKAGGSMLIDNENIENKATVFTSKYGGDLNTEMLNIFTEEVGDYGELNSLKVSDISPKIGGNEVDQGTTDLYVYGADSGVNIREMELSELDMQDNIDQHYPTIKNVIERMERRSFKVHLSKEDIYNFDPFKLVYLRQEGARFYVLRIKNIVNGVGTAQLLKIPV